LGGKNSKLTAGFPAAFFSARMSRMNFMAKIVSAQAIGRICQKQIKNQRILIC
jgi:hypothetical protein